MKISKYFGKGRVLMMSFFCALAFVSFAMADDTQKQKEGDDFIKQGIAAVRLKNAPLAFQCFQKAADLGYAPGEIYVGECYAQGVGVDKDAKNAVQWYKKAADEGNATGEMKMGLLYIRGKGVPEDDAQAVKWFRKAADQGDVGGEYILGVVYGTGKGCVPKDETAAMEWNQKAADQGMAEAEANLASYYEKGIGVSKALKRRKPGTKRPWPRETRGRKRLWSGWV